MDKTRLDLLESKGPETVLREIAAGHHGQKGSQLQDETEAWLRSKQIVADREAASKRDAREEETLAIARDALSMSERSAKSSERANEIAETANSLSLKARSDARRANIIAISAIVFSIITAIVGAIIQIIYVKP